EAQLNEPQIKALRDYVARAKKGLESARGLAEMPQGRYVVKWSPQYIGTIFSSQDARAVAHALHFDAMLRAEDKDLDGAMYTIRAMINASRSIGDEPSIISQLVRIACRAIALVQLERVLAQGEPSEAALESVQRLLEQEDQPLFLVVARGERAGSDMLMENLEKGRASSGGLAGGSNIPAGEFWYLRFPGMVTAQRAAMLRYT